jgi:hypothetical protein
MITFCPVGKTVANFPLFFANLPKLAEVCQLQLLVNQWLIELSANWQFCQLANLPTCSNPRGYWAEPSWQVGRLSPSYYVGEGELHPLSYRRRRIARPLPVSPDPHRTILALDLNETAGWALSCPQSGITSGSEIFGQTLDDGKLNFSRFGTWLRHLNTTVHGLDTVYIGQIGRFLTLDMARAYGGLLGQLTGFCEARRMSCQEVPITTLQKHISLSRKATAHPMDWISAMQKRGFSPVDHHEATALAILTWALDQGA